MRPWKKELRPFQVRAMCDECVRGEMLPDSVTLLSYPAKYPHICDMCGHKENLPKQYPCVEYEEIN